jgi:hypothetical protein
MLYDIVSIEPRQLYICIELKGSFCNKTVSLLKSILDSNLPKIGKSLLEIYLLSFSHKYLDALHLFFPRSNLVYLSMDDVEIRDTPPYQTVCLDASVLSENQIKVLNKENVKLWIYGAYDKYNVLLSKKLGAEVVIVNDVEFTQRVFSDSL